MTRVTSCIQHPETDIQREPGQAHQETDIDPPGAGRPGPEHERHRRLDRSQHGHRPAPVRPLLILLTANSHRVEVTMDIEQHLDGDGVGAAVSGRE